MEVSRTMSFPVRPEFPAEAFHSIKNCEGMGLVGATMNIWAESDK